MFGLREDADTDEIERQLNGAQSVRGGPRTEPGVRKWQDRAPNHTPATGRAQSDINAAQSVFRKDEAGGTSQGLRITGDTATLTALLRGVISTSQGAVRPGAGSMPDEDLREWADEARDALEAAIANDSGNVTLPAFKATPGLDSFNDDTGSGPDEEGY